MSVGAVPQRPAYYTLSGFHRLSVAHYHKLIEVGVLTKYDRVELLEGYMVLKKKRTDKTRIYARSGLPVYWIINVVDRQIEVYTDPRPNDPVPAYATRTDYRSGNVVPLILDGQQVAGLPVDELLG